MNTTAAGYGGGSRGWRAQQLIAHALPVILGVGIVVRVASWFGWLNWVNLIVTAVLLAGWLFSTLHRSSEHLCVKCMDEVPADAPSLAERWRPALWLTHVSLSLAGAAITTVGVLGPAILIVIVGPATKPVAIPGDVWLFSMIYAGWVHHRLRPWCPYCRPWEDDGDEEISPDPTLLNTKTGR